MIYKKLFLISFLITSCSSINFTSSDIIPVSFNHSEGTSEKVSVNVESSFYLWGLLPQTKTIEVDKAFTENNINKVSDISIKEIKTSKTVLWAVLSMGLYYPKTFLIEGKLPE